jgi:hypothetical protein
VYIGPVGSNQVRFAWRNRTSEQSRQRKTATKPPRFGSQNRRTWTYCIILRDIFKYIYLAYYCFKALRSLNTYYVYVQVFLYNTTYVFTKFYYYYYCDGTYEMLRRKLRRLHYSKILS